MWRSLKATNLSDIKDDVGVLVALVGVEALPVVPEQISNGRTVLSESRDEVEGLTTADPQGQVGRLDGETSQD